MQTIQLKLDEAKLKLTLKSVNLLGKKAREAAMNELGATSIQMLGDATKKLRENGSVSTSFLVNSGKVKKYKTHYTVGYSASYAYIVEFGRKIGTMPPVSALIPWVKKKLRINKPKQQKQVAFLIARSIMQNGIKPKPFFYPAYENAIKGISGRIINAVNNALR